MPEGTTNPARRLHHLLQQVRSGPGEKRAREVLAPVFGIPPEDVVALRRALILVDDLFQATMDRISALEGVDHKAFLRRIPHMRQGLANLHLESQAKESLFGVLDPVALEALDLCAARLGEAVKESELSEDDLLSIESQVSELFDYVDQAEIDPELRSVALDLIESMRRAIVEYRIRGIDGLRSAVEDAVGKLTLYYLRKQPDVDREPLNRIWRLVVTVENMVARTLTYGPYLPDSILKMLTLGS